MARRAAQIHQAPGGQQNDALAVGEDDVIDLRLDVLPRIRLQRRDIDLVVEVTDIAHDRVVLHPPHVLVVDHVDVPRRSDEDVGLVAGVIHGDDAIAFHRCLQRADRVDLGDPDLGRESAQRLRRALADVTVTVDHGHLARDHHIGCALDAIDERLPATVQVVELRLGNRIVDVDGGKAEPPLFVHLVEALDAGRGLFGDSLDGGPKPRVEMRIGRQAPRDGAEQGELFLVGRVGNDRPVGLRHGPQVHEQRRVAAVVEDHVRAPIVRPFEDAMGEFPVFGEGLALVGEHRRTRGRHGGGGVILGRVDVARRPANFRAERLERVDEYGGLDGHVQRAGDARAAQRLLRSELFANRHQARHLGLGDGDFLAPPAGERNVGDPEVGEFPGIGHSVHLSLLVGDRAVGDLCSSPRARAAVQRAPLQSWRILEPGRAGIELLGRPVATLLEEAPNYSARTALAKPRGGLKAARNRSPPGAAPAARLPGSIHACRSPPYERFPRARTARSRDGGRVRGLRCAERS